MTAISLCAFSVTCFSCKKDAFWPVERIITEDVNIYLDVVTPKATKYRGIVTGANVSHLGDPGCESRFGDISFVFSQFPAENSLIYTVPCLRH